MIRSLIQYNYITVIMIIGLFLFIQTNNIFEEKITRWFRIAVLQVLVLVIVDGLEFWTASFDYPTMWRVIFSAIGYTIRPGIVLVILLMILEKKPLYKKLCVIPAVLNGIIMFSALFTDVAFSYDANNEFVRGPLGFSTHFFGLFYMILLLVEALRFFKEKNYFEGAVIGFIVVSNVFSIGMESIFKYEGMLNGNMIAAIFLFYLYFHTQNFKRDQLTNAFNRKVFYLDAQKYGTLVNAVIAVDLNNLKQLNDKQGHDEGDKAITTMVKCMRKILPASCRLYRIGGDEFCILCFRQSKEQVQSMIAHIKEEMKKTPYSCAMGMAYSTGQESFAELCGKADEAMYVDKAEIKKRCLS